jgi:hypothetical protein
MLRQRPGMRQRVLADDAAMLGGAEAEHAEQRDVAGREPRGIERRQVAAERAIERLVAGRFGPVG